MGKRRWMKEGTTGYGKEKVEEGRNNRLWEREVGRRKEQLVMGKSSRKEGAGGGRNFFDI